MRLTTKQSEQSAEAKGKEFLSSQYVKLAYAECSCDCGEGGGVNALASNLSHPLTALFFEQAVRYPQKEQKDTSEDTRGIDFNTKQSYNISKLLGGVRVSVGKLFRFSEGQFVANVNYRLLGETATHLWGELVPIEYVSVSDGPDYIVELEDNRKIRCNLKKNVNLGVIGMPPRFRYRFRGS